MILRASFATREESSSTDDVLFSDSVEDALEDEDEDDAFSFLLLLVLFATVTLTLEDGSASFDECRVSLVCQTTSTCSTDTKVYSYDTKTQIFVPQEWQVETKPWHTSTCSGGFGCLSAFLLLKIYNKNTQT